MHKAWDFQFKAIQVEGIQILLKDQTWQIPISHSGSKLINFEPSSFPTRQKQACVALLCTWKGWKTQGPGQSKPQVRMAPRLLSWLRCQPQEDDDSEPGYKTSSGGYCGHLSDGWLSHMLQSTEKGGLWRTIKPRSSKKTWAGCVFLNCAVFFKVLFPWILRSLSELALEAAAEPCSHLFQPHSALWWLGACELAPGSWLLASTVEGMQMSLVFWATLSLWRSGGGGKAGTGTHGWVRWVGYWLVGFPCSFLLCYS